MSAVNERRYLGELVPLYIDSENKQVPVTGVSNKYWFVTLDEVPGKRPEVPANIIVSTDPTFTSRLKQVSRRPGPLEYAIEGQDIYVNASLAGSVLYFRYYGTGSIVRAEDIVQLGVGILNDVAQLKIDVDAAELDIDNLQTDVTAAELDILTLQASVTVLETNNTQNVSLNGSYNYLTLAPATQVLTINAITVDDIVGGTAAGASDVLHGDGSWSAVAGGGSPAGANRAIQINDSSSFGAEDEVTIDANGFLNIVHTTGSAANLIYLENDANPQIHFHHTGNSNEWKISAGLTYNIKRTDDTQVMAINTDGDMTLLGDFTADNILSTTFNASLNTLTNVGVANFDTDTSDSFKLLIGASLDTVDVTPSSNGTTISVSIERSGTGDVRFFFSDGIHTHDCTPPDTVNLTAGTDAVPVKNFVYILQSSKALTASTSGWPTAEHAPIATIICQSAASAQTDEVMVNHVWTDHVVGTAASGGLGHLSHLNEWIRNRPATWESGVILTPTVTTNGGSEDNVDIATTSGFIFQLHRHSFPAFDTSTGSEIYIVNYNGANYTKITDLNAANQDSSGNVIANNDIANIVIWGSVSQDTGQSKLYINLPSDFYTSDADAIADTFNYSNFTIPQDYRGTGFLIARLSLKYRSVSGGTWELVDNRDLRSVPPGVLGGSGATPIPVEFVDSTFKILDSDDVSRELQFDVGNITTATTRTLSIHDDDGTIAIWNYADVTASTTQTQGQQPLTKIHNNVTFNNANDVVTLSAPIPGQIQIVKNVSANIGSIYPASGHDLGEGLNTLTSIKPNEVITFRAIDSTTWAMDNFGFKLESRLGSSTVGHNLINTDNGSLILRLATDSTNRSIVGRDGANTTTQSGIRLGDDQIELSDSSAVFLGFNGGTPSTANLTIAIGDLDTGFYESSDDNLVITTGGTDRFIFTAAGAFYGSVSSSPSLLNSSPSGTVPNILARRSDTDTGIGSPLADQLSLIAGGVELLRIVETGTNTTDQVIIGPGGVIGAAATPGLAFGDGDTGFVELSDDNLDITCNGTRIITMNSTRFAVPATNGAQIKVTASTVGLPSFTNATDTDTGLHLGGSDLLSLITGGVEAIRLTEASGHVIQKMQMHTGISASTTQTQGQQPLLSSYNQISTVSNPNDVVTLMAADTGTICIIINNGANTLQIFPASGDDLGAGVDTSTTLAAGSTITFVARDTTNWEQL